MDGDETQEPTLLRRRQAVVSPFSAKNHVTHHKKNSDGRKMKVINDTTYRPKTFSFWHKPLRHSKKTQFKFEDIWTGGLAATNFSPLTEFSLSG